jgi:murein L,D-transpeptidase YcbB/YkuD
LGRVKFSFPNPFDVYLHDTPSYALFAAPDRAFSHGCIRVEQPLELAAWLLGAPWDRESLKDAIKSGEQRALRLPFSVPIHNVYFTAAVDAEGRLELRRDVYGIDAKLAGALATISHAR